MNDPQQPWLTLLGRWGTGAANVLNGDGYSAKLGLRIACDVIRISNGELSDEVFHGKYHEAIAVGFGKDAHPTEPKEFDE